MDKTKNEMSAAAARLDRLTKRLAKLEAPGKKKKVNRKKKVAKRMGKMRNNSGYAETREKIGAFSSKTCDNPYAATLLDPEMALYRIPDEYAKDTAFYHSIQVIDIVTPQVTGADAGRFYLFATPRLGGTNTVLEYKVYVTEPSLVDWGPSFAEAGDYASLANGTDPRIDDNMLTLLGSPAQEAVFTAAGGQSPSIPLGTAPVSSFSGGLDIPLDPVTGVFTMPQGLWDIYGVYNVTFTVSPTAVSLVLAGGGSTIIGSKIYSGAYSTAVPVTIPWWARVECAIGATLDYSITFTGATVTTNNAGNQVVFCRAPNILAESNLNDYGLVKAIRPVSMSVLATYIGETLHDGGQLAAALVPPGSLPTNIINSVSSAPAPGVFQNWENLSRLPGAYSGRLKEGSYCFWEPFDRSHRNFYEPSKVPTVDYPILALSGQYQSSASVQGQAVMRVLIVTNFEYTTASTLIVTEQSPVAVEWINGAAVLLANLPHATSNPEHRSFIEKAMSWIDGATARGGLWLGNLAGPAISRMPPGLISLGVGPGSKQKVPVIR